MNGGLLTMASKPPLAHDFGELQGPMQGADGFGAGAFEPGVESGAEARSSGDSMPSWVRSRWASPSIPLSRESKASAGWPAVERAAADTASASLAEPCRQIVGFL